ncbi:Diaminobutyrate--2-oxoglutarate aminotransferase [Natranaerofaba carboxydovora]|nr:aspartate aminotransferase family protein [Natranaerofaba carboxydovora]UMZ73032.1 Diaminobutyrate--2-oxoglutarate aminotransferase [Natranaerofaba carboxydovora]
MNSKSNESNSTGINEKELAKLSFSDAPKIVSDSVPGPISQEYIEDSTKYESMARGAGKFPMVYKEGRGATVKDPDGNIYIDMTAGIAVNSVGRRHPRVLKAIEDQAGDLLHGIEMSSVKRTELAKKVSEVSPPGLKDNCITYFTQSGSGAIETAIKFVRQITGKSQIAAFHGAYHGVWLGANSLTTGDHYRKGFGPFMPGVVHLPYPYCYRCFFGLTYPECKLQCAKYVDYVLNTPYTGADEVGAVVIEAEQGEGGYVPVPPGYMEVVKEACQKHGALLIADEVQAGAGRTGQMWAIEHYNVEPDIITWGKGMGGDLPIAGITIRRDLAEKVPERSQPNTWAANSMSCAVSITNIEILTENNKALIKRAGELGEKIKQQLNEGAKNIETIGEVRGMGLMVGIEMVEDKESKKPLGEDQMNKLIFEMLNRGVIMVPCGRNENVFRIMPSLTITEDLVFKATDIFLDCAKKLEK